MISLTEKERKALIILFKDFTNYYNANSISKILGISHVGAQKIFKRLLREGIVIGRQIGKSIVYKPRLEDDYVCKLMEFLLVDEANTYFRRWRKEFKELFKKGRIVVMFGSSIKNYEAARDIDIMVVIRKGDLKEVRGIISEKQELLPKKIHSIELAKADLIKNIKKREGAIIDIIKHAVVLYGQDGYVEAIKNAASS